MAKILKENNHIIWIENLRAIATLAVVLLHVASQMFYNFGKVSDLQWWASNLFMNLGRFSVPCFIMITGALILGRNYNWKNFIKKRFLRILCPFIFWSIIYIIYNLARIIYKDSSKLNLNFILEYIQNKLAYGASYQMWYIYMLIGIYLIFPIFNKWIINSNKKEQQYFLLICLLNYLIQYLSIDFLKTDVNINYFSESLGYLVLGYYLTNNKFNFDGKKRFYFLILISVFLISYLTICIDTYYSSIIKNSPIQKIKPWDLLQTISIFLLFLYIPYLNKKIRLLSIVNNYSFGIYLIHVLIMDLLAKAGLAYYSFNPYLSIPITFICTIFFSILVLYLLSKLPYGKYITR